MDFFLSLTTKSIEQVWSTLLHNWPYLLVSVLITVLIKQYTNIDKISAFLKRNNKAGVLAATTVAVATPLCSCGTTAVVLGMMASMMPWAPIVAFMVSSPLTSPEELIFSAGLFGWPFALAFFLASILLGLAGGWVAAFVDSRGWLANQTRYTTPSAAPVAAAGGCFEVSEKQPAPGRVHYLEVAGIEPVGANFGCGYDQPVVSSRYNKLEGSCGCEQLVSNCACSIAAPEKTSPVPAAYRLHLPAIQIPDALTDFYNTGKRLVTMFLGFAFIGYFLNGLIPASWVGAIFGSGHIYSVPLAATLGLPFYLNSEASLPLIRALLDAGMSQGAAMAFLIAGAGTSIGAIGGLLTIARWRVMALVMGVLWAGAICTGYAYDLVLTLKLF